MYFEPWLLHIQYVVHIAYPLHVEDLEYRKEVHERVCVKTSHLALYVSSKNELVFSYSFLNVMFEVLQIEGWGVYQPTCNI